MADYLPPTEWFYVNLYTKKSQWDRPTEPAHDDSGSSAAPPPYAPGQSTPLGPEKGSLSSNNPYGSSSSAESDEAMARRLQAEEDARSHGRPLSRGAADSYYSQSGPPAGYAPSPHQSANYDQDLPPRPEGKKGFLGKILGKSSSSSHPQQGYPPQQQQYYQGPPQGQYGYQPQQGYYGQGGYPPQQQYMQQQQAQRRHGGLGTGGALALGGGAGLLGGLALGEAMDGGVSNVPLFWIDLPMKLIDSSYRMVAMVVAMTG
ncbi:MAG: hypothetical protein Q9157_006064 [Trypethelium eluteriae]